eukprot:CAMPEP_0185012038 /NCGR_PEP_ID=MMETSP1098-20130426/98100_1 /TAXON_ID=89044 /ORGANISM="Spumella elongata, Strain CCAP 955/1" /LENGTH=336 /DNA_ID=CAMNT_0027541089 /DNA_START=59 /DNA_END=1069 /DNA_ORIENTATION=+
MLSAAVGRSMKMSTQVSAAMVKELREKSGAPMMDCKKALSAEGVNGDIKLAMDWLRAKGIARAASNADRVTMEGVIAVNRNPTSGVVTVVEVNSETDFVSLNKDFHQFVSLVSTTVSEQLNKEGAVSISDLMNLQPKGTTHTMKDALGDIISSIRENIVIKRAENIYPETAQDGSAVGVVASYVHGKVGTDVTPAHIELGKVAGVVKLQAQGTDIASTGPAITTLLSGDVGRKLSMHVVAACPLYLAPKDVPADVVARETAIFREQTVDDKKKPEMLEKIIAGKVNKRMADLCLVSQPHVAVEGSPVIQKYLDSLTQGDVKVSISGFQRWTLGQSQ